jgi:hypothetical protein
VSCQVSLVVVLTAVALIQETSQDFNQVFLLVLVVTPLNTHQEGNATPLVLENAVNQQERVGDEHLLSLDLLDDLEEQSDVLLCLVFLEKGRNQRENW